MDAPQADAPAEKVDAFILFNEHESAVAKVVDELSSLGVSTFFWRRDIPLGERWASVEFSRLENARTVVLFLGSRGWGPNHLELTEEARSLRKRIIPVLIGAPPKEALDKAGALFRDHRYLDLMGQGTVGQLVEAIRSGGPIQTTKSVERPPQDAKDRTDSSSDWMAEFLAGYGFTVATPIARGILGRASEIDPLEPGSVEISTTRLLIATFDVGRAFNVHSASLSNDFGALALAQVLNTRFAAFSEIRSQYLSRAKPTEKMVRNVTATSNVSSILKAASSDFAKIFETKDTLSADALVAALLRRHGTNIEDRFQEHGITLLDLRSAVLEEIQTRDPSRIEQWRKALGVVAPVPETTPIPAPAGSDAVDASATQMSGSPSPGSSTNSTPTTPFGALDITTITFAGMGNDNPDRENLDDKLGVEDEAHAFARVAAARQVDPPLAFGIFGDWGSGKSFFMRLMQEHVEKLANKTADEAKTNLFHENIVQIRFNAWHYVETNLWASLVDYIFMELDRWVLQKLSPNEQNTLFDKLATARDLTLESAERLVQRRKEQKVAARRLADAELELAAARGKELGRPRLVWKAAYQSFFDNADAKKKLEEAAATLGLDRLANDSESLKRALDSLKVESERAGVVTNGIRARLLSTPSLVIVLAAIILVPPSLLWLRDKVVGMVGSYPDLKAWLGGINGGVLSAAGVLASGATLVGLVAEKVRSAVATLEGFRDKLDRAIAEQLKTPEETVKSAEENLTKLTANVAEAQALLVTTTDRLAEATREYASGTGRGRLLRFVRERATDGQYAKHLGLIAAVRKDFTELSAMMSKVDKSVHDASEREVRAYRDRVVALIGAAEKESLLTEDDKQKLRQTANISVETPAPTFQRIILYIDDLDRCPPQKVVDVLQAVHLLLTFPLFVVIVAVDARWVSRSLESHYDNLLGKDEPAVAMLGATPRDYLEKIFQVPYWVRAMTAQGSRNLLMGLAASSVDASATTVSATGTTTGDKANSNHVSQSPVSTAGLPQDTVSDPDGAVSSGRASSPSVSAGTTARIAARALELTEGEQAFMRSLAPFVGATPRRALRFLNVYRVIKASLGAADLQKLEKDGGYRGLMTQLAVTTGSPNLQSRWSGVLNAAGTGDKLQQTKARLTARKGFKDSLECNQLKGAIETFWSNRQTSEADANGTVQSESQEAVDKAMKNGISDLRHYGDLARRYSFSA